jgi:hypothetical protein
MENAPRPAAGWRRLLWFAAIYGASLLAFAALVYGLRAVVPR